jgi:hypothetical protein
MKLETFRVPRFSRVRQGTSESRLSFWWSLAAHRTKRISIDLKQIVGNLNCAVRSRLAMARCETIASCHTTKFCGGRYCIEEWPLHVRTS